MRKKVLAFDLDGTLAKSKQRITDEMAETLARLSENYIIVIITGGKLEQINTQVMNPIGFPSPIMHNFYLLPACGSQGYGYKNYTWCEIWNYALFLREKVEIYTQWEQSTLGLKMHVFPTRWGEIAEDRGSQITFSMLGQNAPLEEKAKWDPDRDKRKRIIAQMNLPDFDIKIGGTTSIDVTRKGLDKAFGLSQLLKTLKLDKEDVLFYGDALQPGGNDYAVKMMGIDCIEVENPDHTFKLLQLLIP